MLRIALSRLSLTLCLCLPFAASALAEPTVPPNVLFIIADDASCHFGAYRCSWAKTPNIDALAASGIVFDNAYVPTSKCSPCRAGLLTGRDGGTIDLRKHLWKDTQAIGERASFQDAGADTGDDGGDARFLGLLRGCQQRFL